MKNKAYLTVVSILILLGSVVLSFYTLTPSIKSLNVKDDSLFSVNKAAVHVKEISKTKHPSGGEKIKIVKDYIVAKLLELGLEPHIQTDYRKGRWSKGKNIELNNILARIKGQGVSNKALLVLAHYDSSLNSYGASDNGVGVAVVLESLRVYLKTIKENKPLNDIIILFTDGEEQGMLGAKIFANNHLWSKDVTFTINLEARGTSGPSLTLIETNRGNANMINLYAKANLKHPVGTSLFYSVYKLMPNDGDSRILRQKLDVDGFLFAFIDKHYNYHRPTDSYDNIDLKSVQSHADYLLPLINVFANTNIENLKTDENVVFFNVPFLGIVYYSYTLIIPLQVLSLLTFIILLIYGFHKKKISWKGIGFGFFTFILIAFLCSILGYYGQLLFPKLKASRMPVNGHYYTFVFTLISVTIGVFIAKFFNRREKKIANFLVVPIFCWILITTLVSLYLKGGSYFVLPLLFSLLGFFIMLRSEKSTLIINTILSIPMLLILSPMVKFLPLAIGPRFIIASTLLVALIMGLLLPAVLQWRFKNNNY